MSTMENATEDTGHKRKGIQKRHYQRNWQKHQINLIHLISKHPVVYTPIAMRQRQSKLNKAKWDNAWLEISTKLGQTKNSCLQQWRNTKHKYAKIMSLINSGKITKKTAMAHPETGKYLDGRFNFMNPYLSEICDEKKIPLAIHRFIDNIFGLKTDKVSPNFFLQRNVITHSQVKNLLTRRLKQNDADSDYIPLRPLQTVIKMAVKCKLEGLLQKNNTMSNSNNYFLNRDSENDNSVTMIPSKNSQNVPVSQPSFTFIPSVNITNKDEENRSKDIKLGLQSELIIEDDVKIESNDETYFMITNEDDNIINMNVEDNTTTKKVEDVTINTNVDKINIMNDDNFNTKMKDKDYIQVENVTIDNNVNNKIVEMVDLENIIPKTEIDIYVASTSGELIDVSDEYIRNFFNELGEITSLELNISKQKILKSRITELLKRLMVGDLSKL